MSEITKLTSEITELTTEIANLREQIAVLENTPGYPWCTIGELKSHLVARYFIIKEAKKERARANWTRSFVTLKEWQPLYNFAGNKLVAGGPTTKPYTTLV